MSVAALMRNQPLSGHVRMLNKLWLGFFLTAAAAALYRWLAIGDPEVFRQMVASLFDMARVSVEVMVLLFGTLTLWLGLWKSWRTYWDRCSRA